MEQDVEAYNCFGNILDVLSRIYIVFVGGYTSADLSAIQSP